MATKTITVPDIGGATGVDVIEILVKEGDTIQKDTPLVTLESDKASMEIPSSAAGVVQSLQIKIGDKVSEGDIILTLQESDAEPSSEPEQPATSKQPAASKEKTDESSAVDDRAETPVEETPSLSPAKNAPSQPATTSPESTGVFASPGVRRLAREFGVDLTQVNGTGRKARITKEDVQQFVKNTLQTKTTGGNWSLPTAPVIDFSKFGEVSVEPLNKIKRVTGVNVHRSWITIPHVTQFDHADITELEAFRKSESEAAPDQGVKLTLLAFVCKVISKALEIYPQFASSLDASGENLIYKKYCHLGIAVETPNGLVVPVIKNVNLLSVRDIAKEMGRLSTKAREKGLMPTDMQGGCFTISSLGGIGGSAFTPIVNSPEVAILGLSRASMQPVYQAGEFKPRLMLPLSLSYDHRVIDGAEAARFTRFVSAGLQDIRKILL